MAIFSKNQNQIVIHSENYQIYSIDENVTLAKQYCDNCNHIITLDKLADASFCATYAPNKYCTLVCIAHKT